MIYSIANEELPPFLVARDRRLATAHANSRGPFTQLGDQPIHGLAILLEFGRSCGQFRFNQVHRARLC